MSSRTQYFRTVKDTVWIYPISDIRRALESTTYTYSFDGTNITCPNMTQLRGLYGDIFNATALSQPVGNTGFSIGVGSILEDMNDTILWKLTNGEVVIRWRLAKQITPQLPATEIPNPGNSPAGSVGYLTTFTAFTPASDAVFDAPYVVRMG